MDKVIIKNLLARGIIGINDWERKRAQDILINLILFTDTHRAGETDNINDCVDYSKMSKKVMAHAESAGKLTVEALANEFDETGRAGWLSACWRMSTSRPARP